MGGRTWQTGRVDDKKVEEYRRGCRHIARYISELAYRGEDRRERERGKREEVGSREVVAYKKKIRCMLHTHTHTHTSHTCHECHHFRLNGGTRLSILPSSPVFFFVSFGTVMFGALSIVNNNIQKSWCVHLLDVIGGRLATNRFYSPRSVRGSIVHPTCRVGLLYINMRNRPPSHTK